MYPKLPMKYFLTLLLITSISLGFSQSRFLGVSGGGSLYSGDLNPVNVGDRRQNIGSAFGISYRQGLTNKFGFRLMLSRNNIEAADSLNQIPVDGFTFPLTLVQEATVNRAVRNLSFQNTITEFALLLEYKPVSIGKLDVILSGGPALYRHNPKAIDPITRSSANPILVELQPLRTDGGGFDDVYSLFQFAVPLGIQLHYALTDKLSVGIEFIRRITVTDFLDDSSSATYAPCATIASISGPVGERLADPSAFGSALPVPLDARPCNNPTNTTIIRGNPNNNDYYMSGTISVWYRMPGGSSRGGKKGVGCPLPY